MTNNTSETNVSHLVGEENVGGEIHLNWIDTAQI